MKKLKLIYSFLIPTWKCTDRCWFCYAPKTGKSMTMATAHQTTRHVATAVSGHKTETHVITLLGGEPLTEPAISKYLLDATRMRTDASVKQINVMFSNGDLLDRVDPFWLTSLDHFQLHIRHLNFKEIERRLDIVRKAGVPKVRLPFVADTFNLKRIKQIAKFSIEQDAPVKIYPLEGFHTYDYKSMLTDGLHDFMDVWESMKAKERGLTLDALFRHFCISWPHIDRCWALCGRGLLCYNPDGKIKTCIRNENSVVGTVWDTKSYYYGDHFQFRMDWHNEQNPECSDCDVKHVCQGDCPNEKLLAFGSYTGRSPMCEVWKEILSRAIEIENG